MDKQIKSSFIKVEHLKLHYLEMGVGEPLLLLHGWPTSSYLWRNLIPILAENNRVIALDLPGFGRSDKKLSDAFGFSYYTKMIDQFLINLEIRQTNLAVHDLGGPLGLFWALKHPEKVLRITFLNTLVFPEFSWAVKLFGLASRLPLVKSWLSGPSGIAASMRFGVKDKKKLSPADIAQYQRPFQSKEARKVLLKSAQHLSPKRFQEMADQLATLAVPVQLIYGVNDRILPDIAQTMSRIKKVLPQATLTAIPDGGHFLQEDKPEEVAQLIKEFLAQ